MECPGTWLGSHDNISFFPASSTPTSAANTISILHDVTVTASVSIDQAIVSSGVTLKVNSGITLTVANGAGTDLTISGALNVDGTIDNQGLISTTIANTNFNTASTYIHIRMVVQCPLPHGIIIPPLLSQVPRIRHQRDLADRVLVISHGIVPAGFSVISLLGTLTTVNGNFTITNAGGGQLSLTTTAPYTLTIRGNLNIADFLDFAASTLSSGNASINVEGDLTISGTNRQFYRVGGSSTNCILNFTKASGVQNYTSTATGMSSIGLTFKVGNGTTTTNTLSLNNNFAMTNSNSYIPTLTILSGSTLNCGTNTVTTTATSGAFTLSAGATIITANSNGLSTSGLFKLQRELLAAQQIMNSRALLQVHLLHHQQLLL